jgi:hypothetical protein
MKSSDANSVCSLAALAACFATILGAYSLYAGANRIEYERHKSIHARTTLGGVVPPEEFHLMFKAVWPSHPSDLDRAERRWKSLLGIPLWAPQSQGESSTEKADYWRYFGSRAGVGTLCPLLLTLQFTRFKRRTGEHPPPGPTARSALDFRFASLCTLGSAAWILAVAPIAWYLVFDREQVNTAAFPIVPVYCSYVPDGFTELALLGAACLHSLVIARFVLQFSGARTRCLQCGYPRPHAANLCPECGYSHSRGRLSVFVARLAARRLTFSAIALFVIWTALACSLWVHAQSRHRYKPADVPKWIVLQPRV